MRILIAGAGGTIGSALASQLAADGHDVARLVRHEPGPGEVRWDPSAGGIDSEGLEGLDAVIDVATMPWTARWTSAAKRRMYDNRVGSYRLLAEALAGRTRKPKARPGRIGRRVVRLTHGRANLVRMTLLGMFA